jgi:hypothetical protein
MHHDDDAHLRDVNADAIFALTRPDPKLLTLYFIYSLMANVAFPFAFLPLYFRYITPAQPGCCWSVAGFFCSLFRPLLLLRSNRLFFT